MKVKTYLSLLLFIPFLALGQQETRKIFKTGRVFTYQAVYKDKDGNLLSDRLIKVIPTDRRNPHAPKRQFLVRYEYGDYREDSIKLGNRINPELQLWKTSAVEGAIETEKEFSIHPIRDNQYKFTEVAAFPEVDLPVERFGKSRSITFVGKGWGDWANKKVRSKRELLGKSTFDLSGKTIDCWQFLAKSRASFGKSQILYKFNDEYGFVEMKYKNYKKETLVFTLVEVREIE